MRIKLSEKTGKYRFAEISKPAQNITSEVKRERASLNAMFQDTLSVVVNELSKKTDGKIRLFSKTVSGSEQKFLEYYGKEIPVSSIYTKVKDTEERFRSEYAEKSLPIAVNLLSEVTEENTARISEIQKLRSELSLSIASRQAVISEFLAGFFGMNVETTVSKVHRLTFRTEAPEL